MKTPLLQFLLAAASIASSSVLSSAQGRSDARDTFQGGSPPEIIIHARNPFPGFGPIEGDGPGKSGDVGKGKPGRGGGGGGSSSNGINYHGGPIMLGTVNAYVIWYGDWNQSNGTDTPAGQKIVTDFLNSIGGSPYYNINTTYYDGADRNINNSVAFAGQFTAGYSLGVGRNLSDTDIQTIVSSSIGVGKLPNDSNGVYFVLTSSDVKKQGFCTSYCGWHTHATISGTDIKYSFVGNAAQCLSACAAQSIGPNGNAGVDGMVSVIAHELEEAATDPDLNAWWDTRGYENADKCAWTFGAYYTTGNGAAANMNLGGKDYLIQRNWVNASGGYCALQYP